MPKHKIILATANSRFSHSSLGLRYLRANLGQYRDDSAILEFNLQSRPLDIVDNILSAEPTIVALGVYIWNITLIHSVVLLLKAIKPELIIVLGGPEISYETHSKPISLLADHIITGPAEISFYELINNLTHKVIIPKLILGKDVNIKLIKHPYSEYTDHDIANRVIYVEASRGCPFKCEFCLSSLDKKAYPFAVDEFLNELEILYQRGVRKFKFVDRTFNLEIEFANKILYFFLDKLRISPIFIHLEIVPDHLPNALKETIALFPQNTLQLEVGLQSFNKDVQIRISRDTKMERAIKNITWLVNNSNAHLHVDLIAALPGEDLKSFAQGFDELFALNPDEIQLGILKRLSGAPISRHTDEFKMIYNPEPPYQALATKDISFNEMQEFTRFARFWDLVANSGRFKFSMPYIMQTKPSAFLAFYDFVSFAYYKLSNATHNIAYDKLWGTVLAFLEINHNNNMQDIKDALTKDYMNSGLKGDPFLKIKMRRENIQPKNSNKNNLGLDRQERNVK